MSVGKFSSFFKTHNTIKIIIVVLLCSGSLTHGGVLQFSVYKSPYVVNSPLKLFPYFQSQYHHQQPLVVKPVPYVYHNVQPLVYPPSTNPYQQYQNQDGYHQSSYQPNFSNNNNLGGYGSNGGDSGAFAQQGGYGSSPGAYNSPSYGNPGVYSNNPGSSYSSPPQQEGQFFSNSGFSGLTNNPESSYNPTFDSQSNAQPQYNNPPAFDSYQNQYSPNQFNFEQQQQQQQPPQFTPGIGNNLNVNPIQAFNAATSLPLQQGPTAATLTDGRPNNSFQYSEGNNNNNNNNNNFGVSSGGDANNIKNNNNLYSGPTAGSNLLNQNSFTSGSSGGQFGGSGPSGSWSYPQSAPSNTAPAVIEQIQALDKTKEFEDIRNAINEKRVNELTAEKSKKGSISNSKVGRGSSRGSGNKTKNINIATSNPEVVEDPSKSEIFGQRIKPGRTRNRTLNSSASTEATITTTTSTTRAPPIKVYLPPHRKN